MASRKYYVRFETVKVLSDAGSTPAASTMKKTSQSQRLRGFSCIYKGFLGFLFAHYLR